MKVQRACRGKQATEGLTYLKSGSQKNIPGKMPKQIQQVLVAYCDQEAGIA